MEIINTNEKNKQTITKKRLKKLHWNANGIVREYINRVGYPVVINPDVVIGLNAKLNRFLVITNREG